MSHLIALVFDDQFKGEEARAALHRMAGEGLLEMNARVLPFVLAGTLAGRLIGGLMDHGITRKFIKDLKQELRPGTSGLVLLGGSDPERRHKIEERMQGFGGRILESNLPPELQEKIESEIERQKAAQKATALRR